MSLEPGDTIGIIGGGQLGRMLAISAGRLGFKCVVLESAENCPASQFCNEQIVAAYDDKDALRELAQASAVVTYEFENVPCETLTEGLGSVPVYPPVSALAISQDRLAEKDFLNSIGISTAPYAAVDSASIGDAVSRMDGQGILKTRRLGYDGKGQIRLKEASAKEAKDALDILAPAECLLEGFVEFEREISIIAARSVEGNVACFDPAENVHRDGILRTSSVPARIGMDTGQRAVEIAELVLTRLDYVGVIGIEFFVSTDGQLLVNEFAPRVHNSGHWTEAACVISQFEQHIRAVSGLPLGNPRRHSDCVMENLIGNDVSRVPEILGESSVMLHLYGKEEVRAGRKMGHFTRLT